MIVMLKLKIRIFLNVLSHTHYLAVNIMKSTGKIVYAGLEKFLAWSEIPLSYGKGAPIPIQIFGTLLYGAVCLKT